MLGLHALVALCHSVKRIYQVLAMILCSGSLFLVVQYHDSHFSHQREEVTSHILMFPDKGVLSRLLRIQKL
jgi:hypothetical protein